MLRIIKMGIAHKGARSLQAALNLTSMVDFMTVVVIFLLMNFSASGEALYSPPDISLPASASGEQIERVPIVVISASAITLEGEMVENTQAVQSGGDEYPLERLAASLKREKDNYKDLNPDKEFDGKVVVSADHGLAFKLVRRVMQTCAEGGYTNILFVMKRGPEET